MDPAQAAALARTLSLITFTLAALWYAVPWLRTRGRADALILLLWVHAFRHVALHLVSAEPSGTPISDPGIDRIIYGDVVAMILAVTAIAALRRRSRWSIPLVWLFVAETAADVASAVGVILRGHVPGSANGLSWLVRSFYVPLVLVSFVLIVWQLLARRGEPLAPSARSHGAVDGRLTAAAPVQSSP
jgi:hypothetical protein